MPTRGSFAPKRLIRLVVALQMAALVLMALPTALGAQTPIFDSGADYRVPTTYGETTEIELADYLADGVTGVTFTLKSCDEGHEDYYDTARVTNGTLVLESNNAGHVHGRYTATETICTVTATSESVTQDRAFSLFIPRSPAAPAITSRDMWVATVETDSVGIQLSVSGSSEYVRVGWGKPGGGKIFGVVSGVTTGDVITIPHMRPGTDYEIQAGLITEQRFDLHRGAKRGGSGALIVERSLDSKWLNNLGSSGLSSGAILRVTTTETPWTAVTVSYGQSSYTVDEGSRVAVTVMLSEMPGRSVTIPITHVPGDGATSADYGGVPRIMTFGPNAMVTTFVVNALEDTLDDDGETVTLGFGASLPDGVEATDPATVIININGANPTPRFIPPPPPPKFETQTSTPPQPPDRAVSKVEEVRSDPQPQAGGDSQPQAGGDSQPQAGGDSQPQAGGDSQPQAGGDSQPQAGGDSQPQAGGDSGPEVDEFSDLAGAGVHEAAVRELAADGVLDGSGCGDGRLCPDEPLPRSEMAAWLVRIVDGAEPTEAGAGSFGDVAADAWFSAHVERLAELEITLGCSTDPPRFCPDLSVTRAQMASLLVRAFKLEAASPAGFADTEGSVHAANIDALAAAGITLGCSIEPLLFCPDQPVTRAQMASFLVRSRDHNQQTTNGQMSDPPDGGTA